MFLWQDVLANADVIPWVDPKTPSATTINVHLRLELKIILGCLAGGLLEVDDHLTMTCTHARKQASNSAECLRRLLVSGSLIRHMMTM